MGKVQFLVEFINEYTSNVKIDSIVLYVTIVLVILNMITWNYDSDKCKMGKLNFLWNLLLMKYIIFVVIIVSYFILRS